MSILVGNSSWAIRMMEWFSRLDCGKIILDTKRETPSTAKKECQQMNSTQSKEMTEMVVEDLMIPAEKVAHVQMGNPLEHALLVLVKSGYSAVPVLDASFKLQGTIGKTIILNDILGLERFEMEKLSVTTVREVMNTDIPCLTKEDDFLKALKAVINHPFICVADSQGYFDGIVTRRSILKQLNKNLHASKHPPVTEMVNGKN